MSELPDGVRGALAAARLALAKAHGASVRRVLPEDDAFTRDEIVAARGEGQD